MAFALGRICCVGSLLVGFVIAGSAVPARAGGAQSAYEHARVRFFALKSHPERQQYRHFWLPVIAEFETVAKKYPGTSYAQQAAYTCAELWHDLSRISRRAADTDTAAATYAAVAAQFPGSSLADDSFWEIATLRLRQGQKPAAVEALRSIVTRYPKGDMAARASRLLGEFDVVAERVQAFMTPESPSENRATAPPVAATNPLVVLDPGHGGPDGGAVSRDGVREKDAVLAIARAAADELKKQGVKVALTRDNDRSVALEERAAVANRLGASLFVSIHANASTDRRAHGVECYYLNVNSSRYAVKLAAVENQASEQQVDDFQVILADMAAKASTPASIALARLLQHRLMAAAKPFEPKVRDLGVKAALFYVLVGVRMPAVLIETSFVSHSQEGRLLGDPGYQQALGKAISGGIVEQLGRAQPAKHEQVAARGESRD